MDCPSFVAIGHVTRDLTEQGATAGGAVAYAALTARNLGERAAVVTSCARDLDLAAVFDGIEVARVPSRVTTVFQNLYDGHVRQQFVHSVAARIEPRHVPLAWRRAGVVHLAPIAREVSPAIAGLFRRSLVGVTPQGYLRRWDSAGRVSPVPWEQSESILPHVGVVILSDDDVSGGESEIESYARQVDILVVTRGARGACVYREGEPHAVPPFPARAVDPTGAGDAFAAAFLIVFHRTGDPLQAARFANAVGSLVVERKGLAGIPTIEEIEARLRICG